MATLVFQAAGAAVGSLFGPMGAILGRTLGGVAGALVDSKLLGTNAGKSVAGPRLTALHGVSASEGAPIPRLYGRARTGGQMIWATRFEEQATTTRTGQKGGKSLGGGPTQTTYSYFANFAIGLCGGPIAGVRRIWADGRELDQTLFTARFYAGREDQAADPLIVAKEGADCVTGFRGLAYMVFERFPIGDFGNRIPQLSFEVIAPVEGLGSMIRAINLIPGSSEYAYSPTAFSRSLGPGSTTSENRHVLCAESDWAASIDALQSLCPNLTSVALVVAWFGDDLRAGQCTVAPRVELQNKIVIGSDWNVAGLSRASARVVSQVSGRPAYGGTPSDAVVIAAVKDLQARGLSVVFYPFVMMDIAPVNGLRDPWTGGNDQPAYPWRGRLTCDPAPGAPQSVEGTSAAQLQINQFFGTASTQAWSYRNFILHYAQVCHDIGNVSAFIIGSELVGLTHVSSSPGVYPGANALAALATDARTILGQGVKLTYAADWTEYGADVRGNGAEVRFPLDVVWSNPAIDVIGIDAYWPMSDWRDGADHLDASLAASIYDRSYLASRLRAGEAFDWYYADDAARAMQVRSAITDGAFGKPWVYRRKDLAGWWTNAHVERVAGRELAQATAWVPQSKPIWLIEVGCPAVDRGSNGPNAFPDAKSSTQTLPPYSRGFRDDLMQARMLEAVLGALDPASSSFVPEANPISTCYNGRMIDAVRMHVWAWDARPFPAFPNQSSVWSDGQNWETGHWLNGRLDGVPLDRLVQALVGDLAGVAIDLPEIEGFVHGYSVDRSMSARGALEPLAGLFGFDAQIRAGIISFFGRAGSSCLTLGDDDLIPDRAGQLVTLTRAQDFDLPKSLAVNFVDGDQDYRPGSVMSRQLVDGMQRDSQSETSTVLCRAEAQRLCDIWLQDLWVARERATFSVRASLIALEPGDAVTLMINGHARLFRIEKITDAGHRAIETRAIEPSVYDHARASVEPRAVPPPFVAGAAQVQIVDLGFADGDPATLQFAAIYADPWVGPMSLWKANGSGNFEYVASSSQPSRVGVTLSTLSAGPVSRLDLVNTLTVQVVGGALSSVSDVQMFSGSNRLAVADSAGQWEILGFAKAELVASGTYVLSRLLRGLGGQDYLAQRTLAPGAPAIVLDSTLVPLAVGTSALGVPVRWRVGPANRDYSDPAFVEVTTIPTSKPLLPLSPVQVKAVRSAVGITIRFVRRGRLSADAWEPFDIPLGEDLEAYQADVLKGSQVVRQLASSTQSFVYAAADELKDFTVLQSSLSVRIYQMSASVGRGNPFAGIVRISLA